VEVHVGEVEGDVVGLVEAVEEGGRHVEPQGVERGRAAPKVKEVQNFAGGAQVVFEVSCERDRTMKPVCVAETVVRVYTG
jgi:hypothetical protein